MILITDILTQLIQFYQEHGVTKVHKSDYSLWIIISFIGSPLNNLAFLHKILVNSLLPIKGFIGNSFQFTNNLNKLKISNDTLFSLNMVSLKPHSYECSNKFSHG